MNYGFRSPGRIESRQRAEQTRLISIRPSASRLCLGSENRQWPVAIRPVLVNLPQQDGDSEPEQHSQQNEIPEGGKPENKDERAACGEQTPDKSAADGKPVHADARMTILRHRTPRIVNHLTEHGGTQRTRAPHPPGKIGKNTKAHKGTQALLRSSKRRCSRESTEIHFPAVFLYINCFSCST